MNRFKSNGENPDPYSTSLDSIRKNYMDLYSQLEKRSGGIGRCLIRQTGAGCSEERLNLSAVPAEGRLAEDLAALMASMRADYLHLMQRMCSREYRDAV
jgi:hypothetical protein